MSQNPSTATNVFNELAALRTSLTTFDNTILNMWDDMVANISQDHISELENSLHKVAARLQELRASYIKQLALSTNQDESNYPDYPDPDDFLRQEEEMKWYGQ